MTDYQVSALEGEARSLMDAHIAAVERAAHALWEGGGKTDYSLLGASNHARLVRAVFITHYGSSLPVERINTMAAALAGYVGPLDLSTELTSLARAKVLRSRMIKGVRHYEINFSA